MKTKVLLLVLALLLIASVSSFATGIGLQGGMDFLGNPYASGLALSFKLDDLPMMFGLGWNFSGGVAIGATADWWFYNENLTGIIDYYLGLGLFGGFSTDGDGSFWLGPRGVAGLQIFVLDPLEIFIEIDPYLALLPSPKPGVQGAVGFRFWF